MKKMARQERVREVELKQKETIESVKQMVPYHIFSIIKKISRV